MNEEHISEELLVTYPEIKKIEDVENKLIKYQEHIQRVELNSIHKFDINPLMTGCNKLITLNQAITDYYNDKSRPLLTIIDLEASSITQREVCIGGTQLSRMKPFRS